MTGMTYYYARVSTRHQKLDLQLDAAHRLGVPLERIVVERGSGANRSRPALTELLGRLQRGDTLACYKLDRIGRSLPHVADLLADLDARGIRFRTVDDGLTTDGPTGRLVTHILGAIAQFERDLILERVRAGLASSKARGVRMGPPPKWTPEMLPRARQLIEGDGLSAWEAARVLGVSRRTLYRGLRAARDHETLTEQRA